MVELTQLTQTPSWDWPTDAAASVKRGLGGQDSAQRLVAAELAGELVVMDDEMAALLLAMVTADPLEAVRGAAAIALGPALEEANEVGFDDELDHAFDRRALSEARVAEIQRALRTVHQDPRQPELVRRMCLEASVRAPQDWHADAVRSAYARPDKPWKMTALFCMGRVDGFEPDILAALDGSDVDLVVEAVRAAGQLELGAAGPRVLDLAASGASDVRARYAAVEALATIETEGCDELLVSLTEAPDDVLAQLAFESLEERRVFSEPPDSGY
jgi:hypothetical protein